MEGGIDVTELLPESTDPAEDPRSEDEEVESFTPQQVLAFVRDPSARIDESGGDAMALMTEPPPRSGQPVPRDSAQVLAVMSGHGAQRVSVFGGWLG